MPMGKTKQVLQPKLTINTPGDKYEQQADAMADRVMHMSANEKAVKHTPGLIGAEVQRKSATCKEAEKKNEPVMRKTENGNSGIPVSPSLASSLNASKGGGSPLPPGTKSFMENAFSKDFSGVRIHADNQAAEMSEGINAKAFAYGNDIFFNSGQFSPNADSGKHLLAHELTHTIQQHNNIQRVPMPDETTVTNLESYTENTRQNIIYDNGFDLQSGLSPFFQKGIVRDVRTGYNVTYAVKGFDPTEAWIEPAMRALALYNFNLNTAATDPVITNLTTVQHLDMTGETNPADTAVSGPDALVRLTSTKFDKTGKGNAAMQNVQLLIEKMGNFSARVVNEKPADRKTRYETTYQITNAVPINTDPLADPDPPQAMSDARFDMVLQALDLVPTSILSQATGIPIHMGLTARGPENEMAEYKQTKAKGSDTWKRRITAYGDFFGITTEQQAFVMTHEFGHALDHRPNEGLKGKGGPVLSANTGKDSFMEALKLDGGVKKGVSTYDETKKSEDEYFAEAFTMYINQPKTLKALRPHIYAYFLAKYP